MKVVEFYDKDDADEDYDEEDDDVHQHQPGDHRKFGEAPHKSLRIVASF